MESEAPGPELETLTASIRDTARRLWLLYVALTALLIVILASFGWTGVDERMNPFNAAAYALSALPTGGFGIDPRSLEGYAPASQWVLALFMTIAGANFALLFRAFVRRKPVALARDEEFRLYLGLLLLASAVLTVILWDAGIASGEEALRQAAFQTVSIMTTTGFASTDFAAWVVVAPAAAMLIVGIMFPGGSAGSTAGSIKVVRHLVIGRVLRRELDQAMHPEYVAPVRVNRLPVDERTVRAVIAFVLLYVGIFVAGAVLLLLDAHRVELELTPFDALAASATTLGNVGPAFGFAGPMGSFEPFSDVSTAIMTGLMWIGRLEIVPVVALFTRAYWRA
jgi:trk system potassium uptake protein